MNKYVVVAQTIDRAREYLKYLVGEIQYKYIYKVTDSKYEMIVEMKNGDIYQTIPASQSSRGHRFNKAYVEEGVDQEIIDCIIRPCLIGDDSELIYFE
jgi:hypothetical protein